jgi:hypothetical protein
VTAPYDWSRERDWDEEATAAYRGFLHVAGIVVSAVAALVLATTGVVLLAQGRFVGWLCAVLALCFAGCAALLAVPEEEVGDQ